jgi:hypothetical protein
VERKLITNHSWPRGGESPDCKCYLVIGNAP